MVAAWDSGEWRENSMTNRTTIVQKDIQNPLQYTHTHFISYGKIEARLHWGNPALLLKTRGQFHFNGVHSGNALKVQSKKKCLNWNFWLKSLKDWVEVDLAPSPGIEALVYRRGVQPQRKANLQQAGSGSSEKPSCAKTTQKQHPNHTHTRSHSCVHRGS